MMICPIDNLTAKRMIRMAVVLLLFVSLAGCAPPHRFAADGYTPIPLEWRGEAFPPKARVPANGPIDFESLYVTEPTLGFTGWLVDYVRFWPSGKALIRIKAAPDSQTIPTLDRTDGMVRDEQFATYGDGHGQTWRARIGRWRIHDGEIYIETFGLHPEGLDFITRAGPLTGDGFMLKRVHTQYGLRRHWRSMPPDHYTRQHVGPMKGEPTW